MCGTQAVDEENFEWEASDGTVSKYHKIVSLAPSSTLVCVTHAVFREKPMGKWDTGSHDHLGVHLYFFEIEMNLFSFESKSTCKCVPDCV